MFLVTVIFLYDQKEKKQSRKEENLYLTMHLTHYIYGYMVSDIW